MTAGPATGHREARGAVIAYLRHVTTDDLPKIAASLTYFLTLSFAPALIVVLALLGLVGVSPHAIARLLESAASVGPQWFVQFVDAALQSVLRTGDGLALLLVGIALALWTASSYVAAFMWAAGNVTGVRDTRGLPARLLQRLGLSLVLLVFIDVAAAAAMLVGAVSRDEAQARSRGALFGLALGALGGCMIPFQAMSASMQTFARLIPHTWAVLGVQSVIGDGAGLAAVAVNVAVLAGYAAVLMVLAGWRYRRAITA